MITDTRWEPYFGKWMQEACKNPKDFSVIISVNDNEFVGVINWIFGETLIDNLNLYNRISSVKTLDGKNFSW